MSESLDEVLTDENPEPTPEPTPEPEPAPEPTPEPEVKTASSAEDDRIKAMERELWRVREKLREKEETPKEPTNIWEDPEGRLGEITTEFDSKLRTMRNQISETYAKLHFGEQDYNQKLDVFLKMAEQSPHLVQQMNQAPDPAVFAYETAKKHILLEEIGDVSSLEAKLKKQAEAEIEAKYKKLYEDKLGKTLPDSLADTRAAADNRSVVTETLDDVIGVDALHRS